MKKPLFIFAVFTAALIYLRVVLKLEHIDAETGFYTEPGLYVTLFGFLLAAGVVLAILFAYGGAFERTERFAKSKAGALMLLLPTGAALLVKSAIELISVLDGPSRLRNFSLGIEALGSLAALCLVKTAFDYFTGKKERVAFPVAVLPVVYALLVLVKRFYIYNSINSVSDNLLEVLFYAAFTVLMLEQVRVVSQMGIQKGLKSVAPAGLVCAMIGLTLVSGQLAALIAKVPSAVDLVLPELIFIALISLYALVFSSLALGARGKRS